MSLRIFPDPPGNNFKRPFLVPADKICLAPFPSGLAEGETIVELQGGFLPFDQFQLKEGTEEEEGFAVGVLLFQSRLRRLYLLPRAYDPVRFLLNEGVDFRLRHAQRRADGERPVTLDDQRNGPAFTADKFVNLDLYKIKKPLACLNYPLESMLYFYQHSNLLPPISRDMVAFRTIRLGGYFAQKTWNQTSET